MPTAFAPASIGNVAVGFDVLGCAFDGGPGAAPPLGDRVTVTRAARPGVRITAVTGVATDLPTDPEANTATMGLVRLLARRAPGFGLDVAVHKGIPIGSGLGSSAASAVASAVAASAVLDAPLSLGEQLHVALTGEAVASGAWHADNVAPMLYGGLVLTRAFDPEGIAPPDVVRIPVPTALRCVLVRPHQRLETRRARTVLPAHVPLADAVQQTANAAALVAGCYQHDLALVGRALRDVLVEPHRKALVPGFDAAQAAAMDAGALGCSLSGAGPTTFAWCAGDEAAAVVCDAMTGAFADAGYAADAWHGPVAADGARLVATEEA